MLGRGDLGRTANTTPARCLLMAGEGQVKIPDTGREYHRAEDEGQQSVAEHKGTQRGGQYPDVGGSVRHPDHETEVEEIDVTGFSGLPEIQAAGLMAAEIDVSILGRIHHVKHRPGEKHPGQSDECGKGSVPRIVDDHHHDQSHHADDSDDGDQQFFQDRVVPLAHGMSLRLIRIHGPQNQPIQNHECQGHHGQAHQNAPGHIHAEGREEPHQNPQNEGVQESYVGGERKKPAHGLRLSSTTAAEEGSDSSPFR